MDQQPSVGRIVHFTCSSVHKAAVIVAVLSPDFVNLRVFEDGPATDDRWETSVAFDGGPTPAHGTWHWPERV